MITGKYFIVVKGNRIDKETKAFRDKQQARTYAASIEGNYNVVDLETVLD